MKKSTAFTLGELQSKLSGYVGLLQFRYSNLCVEADPASLMPVTIQYDDANYNIEDVADVAIPREDQLQVYPKDSNLLFAIGKAIAEYHPEFKQDIAEDKDEGQDGSHSKDEQEDENENKSIILTMPEVNKDRRDVLMEGVKLLYDDLKVTLDTNIQSYTQKVVAQLAGSKAEEIDEAKKGIEEIKKQHYDLANTYRERKEKQIEEAYQRYLEKKNQKEQSKKENQAATNKEAGQGFKMPETPEVEAPKMEAPKMEAPKVEAPNVETPKMDGFKMDSFKMPDAPEMPN